MKDNLSNSTPLKNSDKSSVVIPSQPTEIEIEVAAAAIWDEKSVRSNSLPFDSLGINEQNMLLNRATAALIAIRELYKKTIPPKERGGIQISLTDDCLGLTLGDGTTGVTSLNMKDGTGSIGFSTLNEKYDCGDKVENSYDAMHFVIKFDNITAAKVLQKILARTIKNMEEISDELSK